MIPVKIAGLGWYLPGQRMTNAQLEKRFGISAAWIERTTGVQERRYATTETTISMAVAAACMALDNAALKVSDLDAIICASAAPQQAIPCTAALLQRELHAPEGGSACFDINATCLGFLFALHTIAYLVAAGVYRTVLICNSELPSFSLNPAERESVALFGDAATAVIVTRSQIHEECGIWHALFETYSSGADSTQIIGGGTLHHPNNPATTPEMNMFHMQGTAVFKQALHLLDPFLERFFGQLAWERGQVDVIVPHQASRHGIDLLTRRLGFRREQIIDNLALRGNCVSASMPLALASCLEASLRLQSESQLEFIWLIDADDEQGMQICQELRIRYPERALQLVSVPPAPHGYNPKTFKLIEGRKVAQGDVLCVLDDDTMLPEHGLDMVLPFLDQAGVGLAFGLPYYVDFSNLWSSMVSIFVNSNSLLTYIPYTTITAPFTINGMFYMLRSETLDGMGGFEAIKYTFADDFAIAHLCRTHGYQLAQTPLCHAISTRVRDMRHYTSLLQRWFVAQREATMYHISWLERIVFYICAMLPTLFPFFLLLSLLFRPSWSKSCYVLLYLGCNLSIVDYLNKKYLHQATPTHKSWLVLILLVLIPIQVLIALLSPQRIKWRGNIVQVERGGSFNYIRRRS